MSRKEMDQRGWDRCDIILVTGDAYVDHPSFGVALIGRHLESRGYRVGIIAAPNPNDVEAFRVLGPPRLFWGVTAGNLDSQLARLTVMRKRRRDDPYLPDGQGDLRPPNATIVYVTKVRQAFKGIPVIIGGIEASLRRFAYYDYWTDKVNRSILFDSKADLLIYGMAERSLTEVAARLSRNESLSGIPGTAEIAKKGSQRSGVSVDGGPGSVPAAADTEVSPPDRPLNSSPPRHTVTPLLRNTRPSSPLPPAASPPDSGLSPQTQDSQFLPSFELVSAPTPAGRDAFTLMTRDIFLNAATDTPKTLTQAHGDRVLMVHPPSPPLTPDEMDTLYALPFTKRPHPSYGKARLAAYEMIRDSITTHRGCYGSCSFCAIAVHQGKTITSRHPAGLLREIRQRAAADDFHGTISDLGGPTANMYGTYCRRGGKGCRRLSCLMPEVCPNLSTDATAQIELLRTARQIPGINHLFITSGIRFDLALAQEPQAYIQELANHHVCGRLKIAPEHVAANVLTLMRKPSAESRVRFVRQFLEASRRAGKPQQVVEYFVSGHPGCTLNDMIDLALYLKRENLRAEQVQDFYPAPLTLATAMFYTGEDPLTGEPVYVPKTDNEKAMQRALLLCHDPLFHRKAREALRAAHREDLIGRGPTCLVPPGP
jgi:uncharacterized radical SAM protein YgiQ